MLKRWIITAVAPLLIGGVAVIGPGLAGTSVAPASPEPTVAEAGDPPASAARRRPGVPDVSPPDIDQPPAAHAPPPLPPLPAPSPAPQPAPPVAEVPPVVESKVGPPPPPSPPPPPVRPIRMPADRLPTTGVSAALAALAGALLTVGGLFIGTGRD